MLEAKFGHVGVAIKMEIGTGIQKIELHSLMKDILHTFRIRSRVGKYFKIL